MMRASALYFYIGVLLMAVLEPPDDFNKRNRKEGDGKTEYGMDYYPSEAASRLDLHKQIAFRNQALTLKRASREQLLQVALDAICLNYSLQQMRNDLKI